MLNKIYHKIPSAKFPGKNVSIPVGKEPKIQSSSPDLTPKLPLFEVYSPPTTKISGTISWIHSKLTPAAGPPFTKSIGLRQKASSSYPLKFNVGTLHYDVIYKAEIFAESMQDLFSSPFVVIYKL